MSDGYVYFIRKGDQDIFKIGMTRNEPEVRLSQIQTSTSDKLNLYGAIHSKYPRKLELELHKKYDKYRLSGEWFNLSEKDVKTLLNNCPETVALDWIEIKGGHGKIFYYQISTNELYIDFETLKRVTGQVYILSILVLNDCVIQFPSGAKAVKYNQFMEDFPKWQEELQFHRNRLLLCARKFNT